jgi:hypothetical protein
MTADKTGETSALVKPWAHRKTFKFQKLNKLASNWIPQNSQLCRAVKTAMENYKILTALSLRYRKAIPYRVTIPDDSASRYRTVRQAKPEQAKLQIVLAG